MVGKQSALQRPFLDQIQQGTMSYSYKGIPCQKNPFDLALYQMLISEVRPRTIVEIGSFRGASAIWFADMMKALSLPPNVHSVDIRPVGIVSEGVTFHLGDANDLSLTLTHALMRTLPRPWLVIEDAPHDAQTTLTVLEFFHAWLDAGEYIVVEDGIVRELGIAHDFDGGPLVAIAKFMTSHPAEYEIDRRYCDWFGDNVTYNVDGFLRRLTPRPVDQALARTQPELPPAKNLQTTKRRPWLYDFELPDGSRTNTEAEPIHARRLEMLRRVIRDHVADPQQLTAIDLAVQEGYFTFELARHFAKVDGYGPRWDDIDATSLMADVLGVVNVTLTQVDVRHQVFDSALEADFILVFGLLDRLEDPVRLLRLASQLTRKHILIEAPVSGQFENGDSRNQRDVDGIFSLAPAATVGGSAIALVPSVRALTSIMRTLGFADIKILEFDSGDDKQSRSRSGVMVYGARSAPDP